MTKRLQISDSLKLPIDWITLATVVYGARGSGKTSFGRVAAEEATKAGQRFCAIDLKGDWYGLKSSANGKGDGIPVVVFGGEHADVPLEPDAGKFVGETVAKLGQSCILDFELLSKGKQIRFLADFFEALYHHNREPLLVLADEAQRYAPQKPGPDEARTLGAVQDAVKLGRKHGLGLVLFTQRGAGLNKEVSELCDMMVAFRTPGPLDQERVKDWLDANTTKAQRDTVMAQLPGLETGTAVFASGHPDLKVFGVYGVRRPETFDSSATPKVGQARVEPKKLAKPDLDELRAKMAAAIERARADDPRALRAEITALKKRLAAPVKAPPAQALVETVAHFDEAAFGALFETLTKTVDGAVAAAADAKAELGRALVDYRKAQRTASRWISKAPRLATAPAPTSQAAGPRAPAPVTRAPSAPGDVKIGRCERGILTAIAQHGGLSLTQASLIAGYAPDGGVTRNAAGALRAHGLVDGSNAQMSATPSGIALLGDFERLPTGSALADFWYRKLGKAEASILRAVVDAYPVSVSLTEAAEAAGYESETLGGNVRNAAGRLRTLALVEGGNASMIANKGLVDG